MIIQKIRSAAWKGLIWAVDTPTKSATDIEKMQISQLRQVFDTLPFADEAVASEAEVAWNKNLNCLKQSIANNDPREFIRWDVVRDTMFVGNAEYINVELAYLKSHKEWEARWKPAIRESSIGRPPFFYRYWKSSGNLIHHAYHLARFEDQTGQKIGQLHSILEFGGGYGSMCRLVHKLGFKGRYVIFDLPHFSYLQLYYLNSLGLPVRKIEQFNNDGIFCVNKLEDIERLNIGGEDSLFIATWSLSETPIYVREPMLRHIDLCKSLLIAYQDEFGEVDNRSYFSSKSEFSGFKNKINQEITHLSGSSYLFAWGK